MREAARRGTRVLFATPHVWPHLTLDARARGGDPRRRSQELRDAGAPRAAPRVRADALAAPAREDPAPLRARGHRRACSRGAVHGPRRPPHAGRRAREGTASAPVIAHPERTRGRRGRAARSPRRFAERGWLAAGERDLAHRPTTARRSSGSAGASSSEGYVVARRLRRPPADPPARSSTGRGRSRRALRRRARRSCSTARRSGSVLRSAAARRRHARLVAAATASISRSRPRRLSDSISIWRTRSRVRPSTRPISSSVCGSRVARGRSGARSRGARAGRAPAAPARAPRCGA